MHVYDPHRFRSRQCRPLWHRYVRDAVGVVWVAAMAWCWLVIVIGLLG